MLFPHVWEIIFSLELMDDLLVQVDKQWYSYYIAVSLTVRLIRSRTNLYDNDNVFCISQTDMEPEPEQQFDAKDEVCLFLLGQ